MGMSAEEWIGSAAGWSAMEDEYRNGGFISRRRDDGKDKAESGFDKT